MSIVVPTFNRARYLRQCLDSLLAQTVPALEILVVDDGSQDSTPEVVAQYGARVSYWRKENGGKPSAVNLALPHAAGSLIWLFDDDDVALPDAIERRLEALAAAPNADFVYSAHIQGLDQPDGSISLGAPYVPPHPAPEAFFLETMKSCFFHLNGALVRREHYLELGGMDAALRSGEDYDFQIRLARIARPAFCRAPSFVFREHEGVRGANGTRYLASQRQRAFRESSAVIGRKLRRTVALGEYLVPRNNEPLDSVAIRAALLNRVQVMANHGCIEELFEDLCTLLETKASASPLRHDEALALSGAIRCGWAYETSVERWERFIDLCGAVRNLHGGRQALRALAKGFLQLASSYPDTAEGRAVKALRAIRIAAESLRLS